jgi:hypothetical protein
MTSQWGGWAPAANWVDVASADLNNDRFTDLVGRWGDTGQWWVALNNGSGAFTNQQWGAWAP